MRISDWSSDVCSSDLGTLLNGLLYRYPELAHVARAGIVHRLDKDTSGLLVVARHEKAQTHLIRQLQARTVSREYLALAHGRLTRPGTVKLDIGRDQRVPVRMAVENPIAPRSEEHTSELQSLMRISYAVLCLKIKNEYTNHPHNEKQ